MFMFPASDYTGEIVVADISIPEKVIEMQNLQINVTDDRFVRSVISDRDNNTHKGDYGKLLIIAGSKGMTGAAYLASMASLKSGAGLITLASPQSVHNIMETKTTEVMTLPVSDNDGHMSYTAASLLVSRAKTADAILIGPGIGRFNDTTEVVKTVLRNANVHVIVEADAL